MPARRSWAIASGGLKPLPPAMTRSAPRLTIFSTSTDPNLATTGSAVGGGRVRGEVLDLGDVRSPAPMANRISVVAGVSDTIRWGAAGGRPPSPRRRSGSAGRSPRARASGSPRATRESAGTIDARRVGRDRRRASRPRAAGAGADDQGDATRASRRGAARRRAHETPRRSVEGWRTGSRDAYPFSRRSSMTPGSATGLARSARAARPGRRDHRSGTVPGSHRLRDPAVWRMRLTCRLYHARGSHGAAIGVPRRAPISRR